MIVTSVRRAGYRARQLLRALEERRTCVDSQFVEAYLGERALGLFATLSPRDQAHSARAAAALWQVGPDDRALIIAALLHDAGKGEQQLWLRGLYVLAAAATPSLLQRLAQAGPGWRGALFRLLRHAELGAEAARTLGYDEDVCRLIADHHRPADGARQRALQWADEEA